LLFILVYISLTNLIIESKSDATINRIIESTYLLKILKDVQNQNEKLYFSLINEITKVFIIQFIYWYITKYEIYFYSLLLLYYYILYYIFFFIQ
jgi:hypothetical protein